MFHFYITLSNPLHRFGDLKDQKVIRKKPDRTFQSKALMLTIRPAGFFGERD